MKPRSQSRFVKKSFLDQLSGYSKSYEVHDNGGRPFKVIANNKGIFVNTFREIDVREDIDYDVEFDEHEKYLVYDVGLLHIPPNNYEGYWIGVGFDKDRELYPPFPGNSILIKINKHAYIFVGESIYQFTTEDEIVDYISQVGNSDVPYPIAYGSGYYYFMLDKIYMSKNNFNTKPLREKSMDLYGEYYEKYDRPNSNEKAKRHKFKNVKILHERLW
jgi:hypothetical protein